ncbi:MAG: hypothetical protein ACO1RX_05665 [Candidatus Sericytochromatia bacterium]
MHKVYLVCVGLFFCCACQIGHGASIKPGTGASLGLTTPAVLPTSQPSSGPGGTGLSPGGFASAPPTPTPQPQFSSVIPSPPTAAPRAPVIERLFFSEEQGVTLSLQPNTEPGIMGFRLWVNGVPFQDTEQLSLSFPEPVPDTSYIFEVRSYNSLGFSSADTYRWTYLKVPQVSGTPVPNQITYAEMQGVEASPLGDGWYRFQLLLRAPFLPQADTGITLYLENQVLPLVRQGHWVKRDDLKSPSTEDARIQFDWQPPGPLVKGQTIMLETVRYQPHHDHQQFEAPLNLVSP